MSLLMILLAVLAGMGTLMAIAIAAIVNSIGLFILAIGLGLLTWLFGWLVEELS